ncbi:Biofilm PGA synthesis lipoprotein PgaB [Bibersteinia trehalosi USDA-ARS-USMARC-190]|uniref:Biofilm PGA synthesis lipoprotein PgaB n=1 Tax=Bibersteinia trehalosi USDA-ARS-USMARC-190 TaxID=1263832 RepID=W0R6N9_BIBTR|nr:poly-beta-1,6-N-acetyl-D-glucosamine N-deacetylase PgaB [Bibersteinia trehalosi]AHG85955.1 Biofilm PGA synthesis lipoprotein PgaB [Bibersteinia trehalosi USDA-ARS-USMARC-190]
MTFNNKFKIFLFLFMAIFVGETAAKNNEYHVLAYHSVLDENAPEQDKYYLPQTIPARQLIAHFNWLKTNGYNVIAWQQVVDAEAGKSSLPDKAVLLSFDDGYESMYSTIFPLLKAYNYPAVFAPVSSWLNAPTGSQIQYGSTAKLSRNAFAQWHEVAEMQRSGLVEIASHTHDLHYGVNANPAGSQIPAVISPIYKNGQYESKQAYRQRLQRDFQASVKFIHQHTGHAPRIIVWPYGQFNDTAVEVARQAGMPHHFSLDMSKVNRVGDKHIGRLLLDAETSIDTIEEYLAGKTAENGIQRVIHVDLDYVFDPNPAQQAKNLDALIQRIYDYGITTVYLQAYADQDGNGVADALYFPNKYLPVKSDLFSQVAWQLISRADVKVYAWMPVLAFDIGEKGEYVLDRRTGKPAENHYLRLNPYSAKNKAMIQSIYQDLAFYAKFNGILFHDDAFLTDFEINDNSAQKTADLIQFTHELTQSLAPYFRYGKEKIKTARNIYASLITQPESEAWFAQNFVKFTQHYDTTAIMAMPYMENENSIDAKEAKAWLDNLIHLVKAENIPLHKVLFELQAVNWRNNKAIPTAEMIDWISTLTKNGIYSFGYYPDNFINNQPNLKQIRPYMSINQNSTK